MNEFIPSLFHPSSPRVSKTLWSCVPWWVVRTKPKLLLTLLLLNVPHEDTRRDVIGYGFRFCVVERVCVVCVRVCVCVCVKCASVCKIARPQAVRQPPGPDPSLPSRKKITELAILWTLSNSPEDCSIISLDLPTVSNSDCASTHLCHSIRVSRLSRVRPARGTSAFYMLRRHHLQPRAVHDPRCVDAPRLLAVPLDRIHGDLALDLLLSHLDYNRLLARPRLH